jgi:putative Mn2+ efflux pump MntP
LRKVEWVFVILFIASGLYCLAIPAGFPMFSLPLPNWFSHFQPYLRPIVWVLIGIGIFMIVSSIVKRRKEEKKNKH